MVMRGHSMRPTTLCMACCAAAAPGVLLQQTPAPAHTMMMVCKPLLALYNVCGCCIVEESSCGLYP